jgi:regulator of cell morphogenesis and NO signaling
VTGFIDWMPVAGGCWESLPWSRSMTTSPSADGGSAGGAPGWGEQSVRQLVDHILAKHHAVERESLSRLRGLAEEAVRRHAGTIPVLAKVAATFALLSEELLAHMDREEQVLFPLLLEREAEGRTGAAAWDRETELARLHREHDHAGDLLQDLRILTQDYRLQGGASVDLRPLLEELKVLDEDLQLHIELENRWLFSRAS